MARMRAYPPEFRQTAVATVVSQGVPIREAATRVALSNR